jgi:hypothetical protein
MSVRHPSIISMGLAVEIQLGPERVAQVSLLRLCGVPNKLLTAVGGQHPKSF